MPRLSAPRRVAQLAPPLPIDNYTFRQAGLKLRQGQFSLVAAAPTVGKSLLATNIALRTPASTLYFTADTDEYTVRQRACAVLSGYRLDEVEGHLSDPTWDKFYAEHLARVNHIDWCYEQNITPEFITYRLQAYAEVRGWESWPQLTIVDNIGDMVEDHSDEGSELRAACYELKNIARTTGTHVMGLCHVVGAKENGDKPINLADLLQKIGKVPEVVLGLHWSEGDKGRPMLTIPKQRGGKGRTMYPLPIDYTTATVGGFQVGMVK